MSNIEDIRRYYAEELRAVANLQSQALVVAFAKVPREHYLGAGPWHIHNPDVGLSGGSYRQTPDADPSHLYHNVVVAIDPSRNLNNGQPSLLAFWLDTLDLKEGQRVLHVGCGVGYYTAVIAEVVGPSGQVVAVEIDPELAERARANLAHLKQVEVVQGDGGEYDAGPCDAMLINAGATHPRPVWLDGLRPGGRLLLPLTFASDPNGLGRGGSLKIQRETKGYTARFHSMVAIYHCMGARDKMSEQRLREAFMRGTWASVQSLHREAHEPRDTCWLHGDGFCLSTQPYI